MFKWHKLQWPVFGRPMRVATMSIGISVGLGPTPGNSQDMEIVMALPAPTLTFSSAFIADDAAFHRKDGCKLCHRSIVGVASRTAVIGGSADFTIATVPVCLRAASLGQRLLGFANDGVRPLVVPVLRKDVAEADGIT